MPPAKIARLEPSMTPHSALSHYHHIITDVGTTTTSVSQSSVTQTTAHPTPPNPLLTDDSSVSGQPPPTHTSATPPLQSSPHPQSAVSGSPAYHQSRVVEDVTNRHRHDLNSAISNDLVYFSNKFIGVGLISRYASDNILTKKGVGNGEKGSQLLSLVIDHFHRSHNKKNWFDDFVGVFSSEAAYEDLATSMTRDFTTGMDECYNSGNYKHSSSSATYTAYPSPNLSSQSHSHTTDRPSLSSQVGRSHVMSHNEPQSVTTQSQASSHNLSSHMQQYIQYVKTVYRGSEVERDPKVVKLQKMPTKVYINLVCIDRKSVGNAREYDEVTRTMVQEGSLDVVHGKKWPIEFNEISNKLPATSESFDRVVLVEGAPGVGKSTFAWEFCRRWGRGEIAQQYQLVLLLRLREERISNAKSLEDLIYHPSMEVHVCQTVKKELEYNLGVNTLIILEGFDELPDRCQNDGSIFMDLIAGKLLRLATVLVTSRPWATRKMLKNHDNRIYQHIEILGFKDHQITEYIESTLPQDKASDLKAYLESHPQIRAGMYIPLNSAIVVTVYEESQASGCAMPTTLTELYTSLTRTLLHRYLRGHPEYGTDGTIFLQTFKDLPQPVYTKFCEVCKLAYSGTVGTEREVKLIYRKSDMPSDFDDLGFMDSVIELYETRPEATSYNFLHLTFQEFFAAVHIFNKSPEEQVEHFKRHKEGRLKVVLRFLAGLNKLNCFSIEENANNFFQTPSTREGSRYLIPCDAAVGIDLVQWLFEAQNDGVIEHVLGQKTIEFDLSSKMLPLDYYSLGYCLSHSQCLWVLGLGKKIGEDEVRMLAAGAGTRSEPRGRVTGLKRKQTERSNSQMKEKSLLSLSGKCLSMLFTEWKSILCLHQLSMELPARCDQITWPDLSALRVLELETKGHTKRKLETLLPDLSLESLTVLRSHDEECVAIGDHITSTTTLKELCILSSDISEEKGVEAITAALASNQSLPLERLELECKCTFTATAGDSLAQFITNTTTLKHLSIKRCTFSAHALLVLARAIHHNSILQTKNVEEFSLTVNDDNEAKDLAQLQVEYPDLMNKIGPNKTIVCSNNSISDAGAEALTQALLHHNSTLKTLDLSNNSITNAGAVALAQALHHNSTLTQLSLSSNSITDAGAVALVEALHHNSTLTELVLSNNSISDAGAVALAEALHHNSTLTRLDLSKNSISDAGAVALAQALRHNSTLTRLDLSKNSISDAGAVALAQVLHHNSTLTELYLSNNSITNAGAVALAQALHHNSTLTQLSLSSNSITDAGAVALAQALHHNSTLTRLDLSNNSISDAGAVALAEALHHNSTLTRLDLSKNSISDAGAVALAQALRHNSTLTRLDLSKNSISDAGAVALAQALHHNSTLTELVLSNNSISDAGAVALAQALHHNSTLTWLVLSNNSISDAGAVALAQALYYNSTLTWLVLSNNSISDAGAVALAQALYYNSTLTDLDLPGNDGIGEEGTRQLVQAQTMSNNVHSIIQ